MNRLWLICLSAVFIFIVPVFSGLADTDTSTSKPLTQIAKQISANDSILVVAMEDLKDNHTNDHVILSKNDHQKRIPASILKILTSLVAFDSLGPDYHFRTEFYLDKNNNLKVKGYGDPYLVSENLDQIGKLIAAHINKIDNIFLDDSYFARPIDVPGRSKTTNPYDAPLGALCANFNTVYFARNGQSYVSAEPQTPLIPFSLKRIKKMHVKSGRILFSHKDSEMTLYTGYLLKYFLNANGVKTNGQVRIGRVDPNVDKLILTYESNRSVTQVVKELLEYSNNFIANQLLVASGAKKFGPPATLEKGVLAAKAFCLQKLGLKGFQIVEGSGISRQNRFSAQQFDTILKAFYPYRLLMNHKDQVYYKTGTLNGIHTRAGYVYGASGTQYRFVLMVNTPHKGVQPIMDKLIKALP